MPQTDDSSEIGTEKISLAGKKRLSSRRTEPRLDTIPEAFLEFPKKSLRQKKNFFKKSRFFLFALPRKGGHDFKRTEKIQKKREEFRINFAFINPRINRRYRLERRPKRRLVRANIGEKFLNHGARNIPLPAIAHHRNADEIQSFKLPRKFRLGLAHPARDRAHLPALQSQ